MLYSQTQDYRSNVLLGMYIYMILGLLPGVSGMLVVQVKETAITHFYSKTTPKNAMSLAEILKNTTAGLSAFQAKFCSSL